MSELVETLTSNLFLVEKKQGKLIFVELFRF